MLNKMEKGFVKFIDSLATRAFGYGPYTEYDMYQPKAPKKPVK